jgi:hypothetical protein
VLPAISHSTLVGGLVMTACGWWLLGLSLQAMLGAIAPEPMPWSGDAWARCTGYISLSYVVGFVAFFVPGGLGVREVILQQLLVREFAGVPSEQARALAWGAAILLRLLWVAAEVIMALVVYAISGRRT